MDEFLFSYANAIEDMPEEEFQKYKDSLIAYKLRKDLNLSAQRDRYWAEIVRLVFVLFYGNVFRFSVNTVSTKPRKKLKCLTLVLCLYQHF